MTDSVEFSAIAVRDPNWSEAETKFVAATAALFEKTVQMGIIPAPLDDKVVEDIGILFGALDNLDEADPEFVDSYIMPVANPWNENRGRAPGRLGGFFGTTLLLNKIRDRVYAVSVGGVD